jgi:uncharacterized protein
MDTMKALISLQENYDIMKEQNRILKDGSNLYLLKKLKHDFEKAKEEFVIKDNKVKEIKDSIVRLSNKINNEKKEIERHENVLQNTKSSAYKTISNLQRKIEGAKGKVKILEDESIELLECEEKFIEEKEALRVELINLKENFYKQKESINGDINRAQEELSKTKRVISELRKGLPEKVLLDFDALMDKKGSSAAKLEGGMCSACRMTVSAMTMDNMYKKQGLVKCNNCGRFLYYSVEDLKQAR